MIKQLFPTAFFLRFVLYLTPAILLSACSRNSKSSLPVDGYTLVWADEFDAASLDTASWDTRSKNPAPFDRIPPRANCDFRNAEIFLDEMVTLENGMLVLTARKAPFTYRSKVGGECKVDQGCRFIGCDSFSVPVTYRSGSVFSKTGYNHGYFEARVKIPDAKGMYPVFWLWHHDELVVFEFFGDPNTHFISMHNKSLCTSVKFKKAVGYAADFHTYGLEWTPFEVKWFIDGVLIKNEFKYFNKLSENGIPETSFRTEEAYTVNDTFPESKDRWMGVNLSLRVYEWADWVDTTALPAQMQVDYIRIYQKK